MDKVYINRCLQLAKHGLGLTAPNPMVGAVVVHEGLIIGEGYTSPYGGNHAEVNAIHSVKDKSLLSSATIYVSLEPCSHFGKTPPCADLIIKHKIPRVVVGCVDTFSEVSGRGISRLRQHGCEVTVGVMEAECQELNKRFFTFHTKHRPYVILKWAQTQDGFIAPENNSGITWITNSFSKQLSHRLRANEQAILIGTNTALVDNPSLTCRDWQGSNPIRVVLDKDLKISNSCNVFNRNAKTIVLTGVSKESDCEHVVYEKIEFENNLAKQITEVLVKYAIQSVIVEGGSQMLQTFIDEGIWDEANVFVGAKSFTEGIEAPRFKGKYQSKTLLKTDVLHHYIND